METRFWSKVDQSGGEDACWLWTANTSSNGYGVFALNHDTPIGAHRMAYELANGAIPEGAFILHDCDVKACVNPRHLRTGTHADNMRDRRERGRQAKGETNGRAGLSEADIHAIREAHESGESLRRLAARFGTSKTNIALIVKRETWAHV